jgi:hypothetical protein
MYSKVVGYVIVRDFVFWVRGLLGKVVINGWVLICENRRIGRYVPVDVAGRVSEHGQTQITFTETLFMIFQMIVI